MLLSPRTAKQYCSHNNLVKTRSRSSARISAAGALGEFSDCPASRLPNLSGKRASFIICASTRRIRTLPSQTLTDGFHPPLARRVSFSRFAARCDQVGQRWRVRIRRFLLPRARTRLVVRRGGANALAVVARSLPSRPKSVWSELCNLARAPLSVPSIFAALLAAVRGRWRAGRASMRQRLSR